MIIQRAPRLPEAECMEGEETLQWALAYAASGQPVFPCRSSGSRVKTPLTRNGFYDASADPERIVSWWTRHPDAAIGIPTGAPYFTVLDIDTKVVDGFVAYQRLHRAGLLNGGGRLVRTPSGGIHRYFRGGAHGNASLRDFGVDLRGVGGYVIAPPSRIESPDRQAGYEVLREYTVHPAPLDWQACRSLLAPSCPAMRNVRSEGSSSSRLVAFVLSLQEGERNNGFYWAVCEARDRGGDVAALIRAAHAIGLSECEVNATVRSAMRAEKIR